MEEIWKNVHAAHTVKCHAGNFKNVDLFFTVNYTMMCSSSLAKSTILTVFYCKIALNVIAVILHTETYNQLTGSSCSIFTVYNKTRWFTFSHLVMIYNVMLRTSNLLFINN